MSPVTVLLLGGMIAIAGCASTSQQRTAENAAVKKEAAQEIDRICSLPESERETELQKLKEESGLVLFCGRSSSSE